MPLDITTKYKLIIQNSELGSGTDFITSLYYNGKKLVAAKITIYIKPFLNSKNKAKYVL